MRPGRRREALLEVPRRKLMAAHHPDISLAREKLGWQPAVPLKEGLVPTIEYFDRLLSEDQQG
jgi:nucleoside-diphosphate-sugar epimerase